MDPPITSTSKATGESPDFSVVIGGPLYQLWRRTRLTGDALQLMHRRIIVLTALVWIPLLVLSIVEGHAWGASVELPFLYDIEAHARLLLALPLLVLAELVVHQRMRLVVRQFVDRGLVPPTERAKFDAAIMAAMRLRNSIAVEVLLAAFVYIVGVGFVWRTHVALDLTSWYGVSRNEVLQPSLAGWWLGCVSLPIFQFLLLRWYFRMFVWARFLRQVARINLQLMPTHPDRCGGLGFLSSVSQAFAPLLLAQGALLAGMIADRIFFAGARLPDFKLELMGLVAVMVFAILGPMLVFVPMLAAVKRVGVLEYGALAHSYVREFDQKWVRGGAPPGELLIGNADIQSLADLDSGYSVVQEMRLAPFTLRTMMHLGVITLLPVAPLLLTVIPLDQLLERLLQIVF